MIKCIITSPQKTTIYKNIQNIRLPAFSGQMQILPGHTESFIILKRGRVFLKQLNGKSQILENINGECYVKNNIVTIIL